jgi:hypothetical protein
MSSFQIIVYLEIKMDACGALRLLPSFDLINCILPLLGSLTMLWHPFQLVRSSYARK